MFTEASATAKRGVQAFNNLPHSYIEQGIARGTILDSYNPDGPFPAASLAKLYLVAASLWLLSEQGQVDLSIPVKLNSEQFFQSGYRSALITRWRWHGLCAIASRARGFEFVPPMSAGTLFRRAIHDSDNVASVAIADAMGRSRIQGVLDDWGLKHTTIRNPEIGNPNVTTARDMGQFLCDLRMGRLIDYKDAQLMRSWMRRRLVPNQLGEEINVVYKDGHVTENGTAFSNLCGYMSRTGVHAFAMFTKSPSVYETTYPQEAYLKEKLAKMAYEFE